MLRDSVTVDAMIDATPEVVWRFLTLERSSWWPDLRFDPVVGSPLVETWLEDGPPMSASGTVTRCEEPHLLGFTWTEPTWVRPLDVEIRLVTAKRSTAVTLTEAGFLGARTVPTLPDEHEEGWRYHLARLKRAVEVASIEDSRDDGS
ncbi:SRPBCC family protein [Rathayibacter sp. Leaf296]|uniref:SRPBCC family protein n=1 Tax=Rathayibacter sp. Leaf296 TaxID=1736327 RepID=UPI000AF41022|nr:SRPBCC domain-containing protein [Rathayibacter sp. Leaf296]